MDEQEIMATPIGFAELILGLNLYPWQDKAISWFHNPRERTKASVVTPNGAGKSSGVVAALALWWLAIHPKGIVVITTKDGKQLKNQIYPALVRHKEKFDGWTWVTSPEIRVTTPTGGMLLAFTTDDAGRAEGWHKIDDITGPLLMIIDEAKSVDEKIFEAVDRCTFNGLLYVSSPGVMAGRFFESQTSKSDSFKTLAVSLEECPHIPRDKIDDIIKSYGEDHPFTQSSIYGRFMTEDETTKFVFRHDVVQRTIASPPKKIPGSRSAFCDFAGGGDENVLAIRDGNAADIAMAWRETDTSSAVGRFVIAFNKEKLSPGQISADEGGLGRPMCDSLRDAGWPVNRVNNQGAPFDDRYENRGAEMWFTVAAMVNRVETPIPDDPKLIAQLTSRKVKVTSRGKLGIESKEDMKARGVKSPDRADAWIGALANTFQNDPKGVAGDEFDRSRGLVEQAMEFASQEEGAMAGADAGW